MIFSSTSFGFGFITGFGTGLMTREISRGGASVLRPMIKSAVKTSMLAFDQLRATLAFARESLEDIVAEARDEAVAEAPRTTTAPKRTKKTTRRGTRATGSAAALAH